MSTPDPARARSIELERYDLASLERERGWAKGGPTCSCRTCRGTYPTNRRVA